MTRDCWQLTSPVAYSYQTMDQLLLSSLQWDSGRLGLRVDNLPIEVRHNNFQPTSSCRGRSRGRMQGMHCPPPPPPPPLPEMSYDFLTQLVFYRKSQLCHSFVVQPLLRTILDSPLSWLTHFTAIVLLLNTHSYVISSTSFAIIANYQNLGISLVECNYHEVTTVVTCYFITF